MDNISTRDEEILRAYKDLRESRDRAGARWRQVEDDADHPSLEYIMYRAKCCELRGFCTALELMGFDMEALVAMTEEV